MQSLSPALTKSCCLPSKILDPSAPVGAVRDCPDCGQSYINDHGKWRNTYSIDQATKQRLLGSARVVGLMKGYR